MLGRSRSYVLAKLEVGYFSILKKSRGLGQMGRKTVKFLRKTVKSLGKNTKDDLSKIFISVEGQRHRA